MILAAIRSCTSRRPTGRRPTGARMTPDAPAAPDFAALKLLVLDVDGVLTDGGLYVGDDGGSFKRFAILDGAGLVYWREAGLRTALISGHASDAVKARFQGLGVEEIHVGVKDKLAVFEDLLRRLGVAARETVAVGDDYMDLPVLRRVGFAACPPHAHAEIRAVAHLVTRAEGGYGCVREVIEHVLARAGRLDAVVGRYRR
jgi:3-deoxy-D-manno-octulosonate 8-phosphate phosphatase (KDO 8-P phosphatase)